MMGLHLGSFIVGLLVGYLFATGFFSGLLGKIGG